MPLALRGWQQPAASPTSTTRPFTTASGIRVSLEATSGALAVERRQHALSQRAGQTVEELRLGAQPLRR